ncbi:MAG: hypothetical protein MUF83_16575 [Acidimicrobiales bacterium]|jgi:hypothetical protein|nr:hypothetical protein [Acidimicrobiales bacterium]
MSTTTQPTSDLPATSDDVDRGFGMAIVIGAAIGIVFFVALIAVVVKVMWPDLPTGGVIAVALWTGLWAGLFLGGTITVGRWSAKNFH